MLTKSMHVIIHALMPVDLIVNDSLGAKSLHQSPQNNIHDNPYLILFITNPHVKVGLYVIIAVSNRNHCIPGSHFMNIADIIKTNNDDVYNRYP